MKGNSSRPQGIILGLDHPRSLAVISSLGEMGVPVVGICHHPFPRASSSRYLRTSHRISADPAEALAFLVSLGERHGGVLMPTTDEYVILVSRNAELLAQHFVLAVPAWDVVEPLMDLIGCYTSGRECGIKTPNIAKPQSENELRAIVADLDVVKHAYLLRTPAASVPADTRTNRFTKAAGSDAQSIINNCLEIHSRLGDFPIIAEAVRGDPNQCISVQVIANASHEAVVAYCIRRLTLDAYVRAHAFIHPYELGALALCESIHDEEAIEAAKRFVRHAKYVGALAIEFRRDPDDGRLVLIKVDVCLARELSISRAIGVDAPTALYRTLINEPFPVPKSYAQGVGWLWLTAYLSTLWTQRSNRSVLRELLSAMRRFHRIRAMAFWSPRDPIPFVTDIVVFLKDAVPRALRQIAGSA